MSPCRVAFRRSGRWLSVIRVRVPQHEVRRLKEFRPPPFDDIPPVLGTSDHVEVPPPHLIHQNLARSVLPHDAPDLLLAAVGIPSVPRRVLPSQDAAAGTGDLIAAALLCHAEGGPCVQLLAARLLPRAAVVLEKLPVPRSDAGGGHPGHGRTAFALEAFGDVSGNANPVD